MTPWRSIIRQFGLFSNFNRMRTVYTVPELRTLVTSDIFIRALGLATTFDGGGGVFYRDVSSSQPDDGKMVVSTQTGVGRWIRILDNSYLIGDMGRKYRIVSCVLRNSGSGWAVIEDADHRPQGVSGVSSSGDDIRLNYSFTASKVGSLLVTPDETLAALGLGCGASVGMSFSNIRLSVPLSFAINLDLATVVDTPAYVMAKLTMSDNGFYQRVTHPVTSAIPTCSPAGSSHLKHFPTLSYGDGVIDVYQLSQFSGYIYYDGTQFILQKNNRSTVFSAVWDTDHLVVSHDTLQVGNSVNLTPYLGVQAHLGSSGNGYFHVYFYDMGGNLITAPSTAMKFWFNRPSMAQVEDLTGYVSITRGFIPINSADLVSASGNLWVFGVFEV